MKLAPMSYRDYVWPHNPETIRVERAKSIRAYSVPNAGDVLQNLGNGGRVVTGGGAFTGETCMEEFARLSAAFSEEGGGTLRVPGFKPFEAVFSSFSMKGAAQPDCVQYEFEFREDGSAAGEEPSSDGPRSYVCGGGETLWGIANRFGTDVDALRLLNPSIEWPNALEAGTEVKIP